MTKTVYSTAEVPHIFAANPTTAIARNGNRTLFCENGRIYSYRYSAPLAAWRDGVLLINSDRYSVTTAKHQSYLARAVRHLPQVQLPDLRAVIENPGERGAAEYIAKRAKEIDALKEKASRLRSDWTKAANAREIAELETACAYVWKAAGKKTEWRAALAVKAKADKVAAVARYVTSRNRLESGMETARRIAQDARDRIAAENRGPEYGHAFYALANARGDICRIDEMGARHGATGIAATATFQHAAKLMGKRWVVECTALAQEIVAFAETLQPEIDAARAAYETAVAVVNAEKRAAWLAGDDVRGGLAGPILCRVKGETVETSQGARVPLAQALQLAALAKQCRETGRALDLAGRAVGPYRGNKIEADGRLIVGCHSIPWDSIADAVARYEGAKA